MNISGNFRNISIIIIIIIGLSKLKLELETSAIDSWPSFLILFFN